MARLVYKKRCDVCRVEGFKYRRDNVTGKIICTDCIIKEMLFFMGNREMFKCFHYMMDRLRELRVGIDET